MNFQRDGQFQMAIPKGRTNYEPNGLSAGGESRPGDEPGPRECPVTGYRSIAAATGPDEDGGKLRIRAESFADHYSQARLFFRSLAEPEQAHLASALVFELSKVGLPHVRTRMMANLVNVDPALAKRVADGLNMDVPKASPTAAPVKDMELSPALRIIEGPHAPKSIEGRTIAVLIADGSDAGAVDELTSQIGDAGGRPVIVAPKIGGAKMSDGSAMEADFQLAGGPSVLFDAVAVVLSDEGCAQLLKEAAAVQFVMDVFGHLKAIGHTPAAQPLLDKAGVEPDDGVTDLGKAFIKAAATRVWAREPNVRTLA